MTNHQKNDPAQASSKAGLGQTNTPMQAGQPARKVMAWIDALPGVEATTFPAERDAIAELLREADAMEAKAAELVAEAAEYRRRSDVLHGRAYRGACLLRGSADAHWTPEIVHAAWSGV